MAFETLTGGLQLVIPTNGTTNWGTNTKTAAWQKINDHQHTGSGDGNQIVAASIASNVIAQGQISLNFALNQAATLTPAGTTQTIDFDLGNKQVLDLSSATGNVTLTLSNPIAGADYRIKVIEDGTLRTLVWPGTVLWPGGEEPSQFMSINTSSMIYLDYDGTNYFGRWELSYA